MTDTFVLITPSHCFTHRAYVAERYAEMGVENARNIVGRIANLWFSYNRIRKSLKDWERNRISTCQNLADSGNPDAVYGASDRPSLLNSKKQAKQNRDEWHYKANLFLDLDKLMAQLPTLYVCENDLIKARRVQVERVMMTYRRRAALGRLKRKHQAKTRR